MPLAPGQDPKAARLLVVDDEPAMLRVLVRQLAARGFDVAPFAEASDAIAAATEQQFDGAVIDYSLDGITGIAVLELLREIDPTLTIVLLSGTIEVPEAVRAIRLGAEDVQVKPPSFDLLTAALDRGLERTQLQRSRRLMAAHVVDPYGVLDPSPSMQRVLRQVQHAANFEMPILLVGEAGTGKRALAEMVHQLSPNSGRQFRAIGLRGRSSDEIEESLTATLSARSGQDGSRHTTLYLDDLDTLSPAAQQTLLQALQIPTAFRLLVSTRRDLSDEVRAGRLLPALQQRLAVFPIAVPALGERGAGAIETLAIRILGRLRIEVGEGPETIAPGALAWLCNCRWPANIPQLRDVVSESFVRAVGDPQIETHHLTPSLVARGLHAGTADRDTEDWSLGSVERRQILSVLGMTKHNRSQAARLLGITRTTLYKKMAEYGVAETD